MATKHVTGAQYGAASKEEHRASGYRLPDAFYVEAKPDGSGEMSADEKSQLDAMKTESKNATVETENKAVTPKTENKTEALNKPARKSASKSTRKKSK